MSDFARAFVTGNEKTSIHVQVTCIWSVVPYIHLLLLTYGSCDRTRYASHRLAYFDHIE